jgi:hypothetical protein
LKIPKELSFRSAAVSREESAAPLLAESRLFADKAGFGMTRVRDVFAETGPLRIAADIDHKGVRP